MSQTRAHDERTGTAPADEHGPPPDPTGGPPGGYRTWGFRALGVLLALVVWAGAAAARTSPPTAAWWPRSPSSWRRGG